MLFSETSHLHHSAIQMYREVINFMYSLHSIFLQSLMQLFVHRYCEKTDVLV
jgi:hypothetical protein